MNIILFEEKRVRRAWDQTGQKWYFAIQEFTLNQAATKVGDSIVSSARHQLKAESERKVATPANFKTLPESKSRALDKGGKL